MSAPKLFISYSWTTREREAWVLRLAEELTGSGVETILDKWDLQEGHDALAFMEQMVADPTVTKVIMVVDKNYATKADSREGGVGTETQIISKTVYEEQKQDKFVAITVEKDEKGKPYLPIYYQSRIYIDFCDPEKYSEKFEELLRWIYDKPLHKKPPLGKPPVFLSADASSVTIPTTVVFNRCIDAIKTGKPNAQGCVQEYLNTLIDGLENFRITRSYGEFDDAVIESIDNFIPYRNEFIQLMQVLVNYSDISTYSDIIHKFFEKLLCYNYRPEGVNTWRDTDWDNFRFITHEIFIYAVAIMIKSEKFDAIDQLLSTNYYVSYLARNDISPMVSYSDFLKPIFSIDEIRKRRLNKNHISLCTHLLKERTEHSGIQFQYLMQADFVLFMRASINNDRWVPNTLMYSENQYGPFEIFARAESKKYFDRMKCLISVTDKSDLATLIADFKSGKVWLPNWQWVPINPVLLMAFDNIAVHP